jgi:hypothetical protein
MGEQWKEASPKSGHHRVLRVCRAIRSARAPPSCAASTAEITAKGVNGARVDTIAKRDK